MVRQSSYLTSFGRTHPQELPPPLEQEWHWQLSASCVGHPSDVFFPEDQSPRDRSRSEDAAKRICWGCPVVDKCLQHALQTPENHGVWGAMAATERTRYPRHVSNPRRVR